MTRVVLALGSNLGDRLAALQQAVDLLTAGGDLAAAAVSPVYETAPVGGPPQGDYLNAVLLADTSLPATDLLQRAQRVEKALQRRRGVRNGPRTIDVDVIAYGEATSDDPTLTLPHPRAHERAFVLAPWHDADPAARLPGRGGVAELLDATSPQGVRRRDDLPLRLSPVNRPVDGP